MFMYVCVPGESSSVCKRGNMQTDAPWTAVAVWPIRFWDSEKFQETDHIALPCLSACNNSRTGERIFRNLMFCVKNIFENATSVDTDVECCNTLRSLAGFCFQHDENHIGDLDKHTP